MAAQNIPLTYKGHPLRRKDSLIYYGSMAQKYIIMLQILSQKKDQDLDVATKVSVQLQLTDPDLKSRDRVVKKTEKDSLYAAMDVAPTLSASATRPAPPPPYWVPPPRATPWWFWRTLATAGIRWTTSPWRAICPAST